MCLRSRQGANELQNLDDGKAVYAFRIGRPGRYRSFLKVRWLDDGVGDIECNDTWFAAFDDRPTKSFGRDHVGPVWHWLAGPEAVLEAGLHWYVLEMREDGALVDRIALVPQDIPMTNDLLEGLPLVSLSGLSGERPAIYPSLPVSDVELEALPTGSLVIGRGHRNQITVLASFQGKGKGFAGDICLESATTSLRVSGGITIRCSADEPYASAEVDIEFGPGARRRTHGVILRVVATEGPEKGRCVLRKEFTFVRPAAWAFLGPFPDPSAGRAGATDLPDESRLDALAARAPHEGEPEGPAEPEGAAPAEIAWRLVEDGSCYDELGAVDLFKVYGPRVNVYCYAVTWFEIPGGSNHRTFSFQSDDTATVWIDGRMLAMMPSVLPREHNRLWCALPLHPGLSPVVVKIAQAERYWGFRFGELDWHWQGRIGDVIRWTEPEEWPLHE